MCHGALGSRFAVVDRAGGETWTEGLAVETPSENVLDLRTAPQWSGDYARPP